MSEVRERAKRAAQRLEERLRRSRDSDPRERRDLAILALLEAGARPGELAGLRARDVLRQQPTALVIFRHGPRTVRLGLDGPSSARLLAHLRSRTWNPSDLLFPGRGGRSASPDLFRKVLGRWG